MSLGSNEMNKTQFQEIIDEFLTKILVDYDNIIVIIYCKMIEFSISLLVENIFYWKMKIKITNAINMSSDMNEILFFSRLNITKSVVWVVKVLIEGVAVTNRLLKI